MVTLVIDWIILNYNDLKILLVHECDYNICTINKKYSIFYFPKCHGCFEHYLENVYLIIFFLFFKNVCSYICRFNLNSIDDIRVY